MTELLGGSLNKKSMNTIPFNTEMRTLAYVVIHNLYLMMNFTSLLAPRTIFLYDLYTQKEIDICGHIYHLLTKSITKRNTRTIMHFPTLIMGLIAKTKLKILSGLTALTLDASARLWASRTSPCPLWAVGKNRMDLRFTFLLYRFACLTALKELVRQHFA